MNETAVYAALITALASVACLVINVISGEISKRKYKIWEARLARCDEQIGKFYAPLRNFVEQLDTTDDLKKEMVLQDPAHEDQISKLIYDRYFQKIHEKIAVILEQNMHLLEGRDIPKSFIAYHAHVSSEKVMFSLVETVEAAKASGMLPANAIQITCKPVPYPEPYFKDDIVRGFDRVLARQERLLQLIAESDHYGRRLERYKRRMMRI